MPAIQFVAKIPHYFKDLNNDQARIVADMIVEAIAYTGDDGTIISVDINVLTWKGVNVTTYIYECQPYTWERLKDSAKVHYPANVTS